MMHAYHGATCDSCCTICAETKTALRVYYCLAESHSRSSSSIIVGICLNYALLGGRAELTRATAPRHSSQPQIILFGKVFDEASPH